MPAGHDHDSESAPPGAATPEERPRRVISVNLSRELVAVEHAGKAEPTGHFKRPMGAGERGRVLRRGLEGDRIGDTVHHGTPDMALYGLSMEIHWHWSRALGRADITAGRFGENLTLDGMPDERVCIGDIYRLRSAEGDPGPLVQVTIPRGPCWKLGIAMNDPGFPKAFLATCRVGFYLRVLEEGTVGPGDTLDLVDRPGHAGETITVVEATRRKYFGGRPA